MSPGSKAGGNENREACHNVDDDEVMETIIPEMGNSSRTVVVTQREPQLPVLDHHSLCFEGFLERVGVLLYSAQFQSGDSLIAYGLSLQHH